MIRACSIVALLFTLLPAAAAQAQRAPVPVVLPHAPPITNATSGTLFSAMLAIGRAQQTNPQAAQTASFSYVKAVQQYHSGNFAGARESALAALSTASQVAPPQVALPSFSATLAAPGAVQLPGTQGGLYGADAPVIDADSFLALARGTIDDCAARHDRALSTAKRHYDLASAAFAARNWETTRMEAKAAIDACAVRRP